MAPNPGKPTQSLKPLGINSHAHSAPAAFPSRKSDTAFSKPGTRGFGIHNLDGQPYSRHSLSHPALEIGISERLIRTWLANVGNQRKWHVASTKMDEEKNGPIENVSPRSSTPAQNAASHQDVFLCSSLSRSISTSSHNARGWRGLTTCRMMQPDGSKYEVLSLVHAIGTNARPWLPKPHHHNES
ncbi:hypothetical protein CCM_00228 [Cordyceps militaris CM01]|uniref:Uncharacterized protein n=1 Tax=Cordyceps militaris (strain CM01) TaxID=983644 RepID=G3J2N8_CORMM|nr:uncharacterized protein CCM_00228 [Cordyceps militaris CM01]EGX95574.1 hypothetical protein CCM_00228 [Cordyceps militaris CM01]